MEIKYKNSLDVFITSQQASAIDKYEKCYYNAGLLVKEESFFKGELMGVAIYNNSGAPHQSIINNNLGFGYKWISIVEVSNHAYGYVLHKRYGYEPNGIFDGINLALFDSNGNTVAFGYKDSTGVYDYDMTRKYYFDSNINPDKDLFECTYESDGELWGIHWHNEHLNNSGQDGFVLLDTPADRQKLIQLTGMSQELVDYYISSEIVPNF